MAVTYEPLATYTASGTISGITFSSIPQWYTDLKIIYSGTAVGDVSLYFNGDTASGQYFSNHWAGGASNARSSAFRTTGLALYFDNAGSSPASVPYMIEVDIMSYANTNFRKNIFYTQSQDTESSSNSYIGKNAGMWASYSAINSITMTGTIYAGTTATLYGIMAA